MTENTTSTEENNADSSLLAKTSQSPPKNERGTCDRGAQSRDDHEIERLSESNLFDFFHSIYY